MSKLSIDKKRELAEQLFINEGYNAKTISQMVDISEPTISKWRTKFNWEKRRTEILAAPHKIKELLLAEMEKISKGEKSLVDADALSKIAKAIQSVDQKISLQVIVSVFKEFDNWMADNDPAMAINFLDYHKKFLLTRANQA